MNPIVSALSYWGARTRESTTGRNVANIRQEFGVNPLYRFCSPGSISVRQRELPDNGQETLDLLERLFQIRSIETEPEIVSEINQLIDDVCEERQDPDS